MMGSSLIFRPVSTPFHARDAILTWLLHYYTCMRWLREIATWVHFVFIFTFLSVSVAKADDIWPSKGTVVYYQLDSISERCLVPENLYNFDEDASLNCDHFPDNQIFRFTEAIVGTKIELSFNGNKVVGKWHTYNNDIGTDEVRKVSLGGKIFFLKSPMSGKEDEGTITGTRKGKLILAKANSEGFAPEIGYIRIKIRELSDGIEWRQTQRIGRPVGYLPKKERLLISQDSWMDYLNRMPRHLLPCPDQNMKGGVAPGDLPPAAPAVGCIPNNPAKNLPTR